MTRQSLLTRFLEKDFIDLDPQQVCVKVTGYFQSCIPVNRPVNTETGLFSHLGNTSVEMCFLYVLY